MTGLISILLALTAGLMVATARQLVPVVLVPFVPVLVFQTWGIGSGRGVSPPSTVDRFPDLVSYYVVQAIILALTFGAADQLRRWRMRRMSAARVSDPRRTRTATLVSLGLTAVLVICFEIERPFFDPGSVVHHSSEGSPPIVGLLGIGSTALVLVGLGGLSLASRLVRRVRTA